MTTKGDINSKNITIRHLVQIGIYIGLQGLLLFISAGTIDWKRAWIYLIFHAAGSLSSAIAILRISPDLLAERGKRHPDTPLWDRLLASTMAVWGPFVVLVLAGLDFRYQWTGGFSLWVTVAAAAIGIAGYFLTVWAMTSNRFFSGVIRIQKDRGHRTITEGPYRYIRHPGYLGIILFQIAVPIFLGSLPAILVTFLLCIFSIIRTAKEDLVLQNQLDGYKEYCQEVKYRLIPGIW